MYIKKVKIFNKELKNFKRIQKSFYLKIYKLIKNINRKKDLSI